MTRGTVRTDTRAAGSLWLTVVVAFIPLAVLLTLLAGFRVTAWIASLGAGLVTAALGVLVWHAPAGMMTRADGTAVSRARGPLNWIPCSGV